MPTEETVATLATPETEKPEIETTEHPKVEGETPEKPASSAHDDTEKERAKALRQRAKAKAEAEQARAEADYWRKRALAEPPKEEPKTAQPASKPKLADFVKGEQPTAEEWEQFTDALTDFKANEKLKEVRSENEKQTAKEREAAERKELAANYANSQAEARKVLKDYDEVLETADIPISPAVARSVQESELGGFVAYYLAQNPDEAERISKLSERAVDREIGRIEAAYIAELETEAEPKEEGESEEEEPETPPEPKVAKPPTPIRKTATVDRGDLRDDLSADEWKKRFLKKLEKSK